MALHKPSRRVSRFSLDCNQKQAPKAGGCIREDMRGRGHNTGDTGDTGYTGDKGLTRVTGPTWPTLF